MILTPQGHQGGPPPSSAVALSPPSSLVSGAGVPALLTDIDPTRFVVIAIPQSQAPFESDIDPTRFVVIH